MKTVFRSPSVFIQETDLSTLSFTSRFTVAAMVITASQGPVMEPVTVFDVRELEKLFGPATSTSMLSAKAYLTQVSPLVVIRRSNGSLPAHAYAMIAPLYKEFLAGWSPLISNATVNYAADFLTATGTAERSSGLAYSASRIVVTPGANVYAEFLVTHNGGRVSIGLGDLNAQAIDPMLASININASKAMSVADLASYPNGAAAGSFSQGDILGIVVDATNGFNNLIIRFFRNSQQIGAVNASTSASYLAFRSYLDFGSNANSVSLRLEGKSLFPELAAFSGFAALQDSQNASYNATTKTIDAVAAPGAYARSIAPILDEEGATQYFEFEYVSGLFSDVGAVPSNQTGPLETASGTGIKSDGRIYVGGTFISTATALGGTLPAVGDRYGFAINAKTGLFVLYQNGVKLLTSSDSDFKNSVYELSPYVYNSGASAASIKLLGNGDVAERAPSNAVPLVMPATPV